jgi:ribosomal protein S27E
MRRFIRPQGEPAPSDDVTRCRCLRCGAHVLRFSASSITRGRCSTCGGHALEPIEAHTRTDAWQHIPGISAGRR